MNDALQFIKTKVDEVVKLKQIPGNMEQIKELYKTELIPHMLTLRRLNRIEKNNMESNNKRVKELNQKLVSLHQECDCLTFEASCLGFEVSSVRPTKNTIEDGIEPEMNGKPDHSTRMKLLEEEEIRRKELKDVLARLVEETKEIESLCSSSTTQIDQVKPYIRQLLEKVGPTLQPVAAPQDVMILENSKLP